MAFRVWGPEGAPPLLALHALGEGAASWETIAPALAGHFRVYAPDLRGHGDSDWPGAYSSDLMHGDVVAFLDALGVERADVIGHSMGGVVTYLLASDHPERVGRIVIEDVVPPFKRDRPMPDRPDGPLPFDWAAITAMRRESETPGAGWEGRLERIGAPVLIVGGGKDSPIPPHLLEDVARRIPRSRLVTIPAGHMVHDVEPEKFTEAALEFLTAGPDAAPPA